MYTTLLDAKNYIGIAHDNDADDTLLTDMINRSQKTIDSYCLRTFEASSNVVRYFNAISDVTGRLLKLDRDLCAINTITNGNGVIVTSGQYITQPRNETPYHGILLLASSGINWQWQDDSEAAIAISGKWAFSVSAPSDIVHACIRLTAFFYRSKDAQVFDQTAFSELGAIRMNRKLPSDILELLVPYRRAVSI